ncbi:GNAT family N-acetyltransferase [Petrocella sp. FN5]|uniref:GNAT family N-acetyltransferase n=1 Tax=Petrocella sp. FN5 TaxID=3032002 RepID=UPI0023DC510A|nr:GNAT family N-acetyltransferase [Petrocella sp. FN5]MDF1618024.1 GNAT family N-acetyltransferase [Petrocella sp. FN5]
MENIIYRELRREECERIKEMNPTQYIGKAWRQVSGKLQLVEIDYNDTDWPNGYKYHYEHLKKTITSDGFAIGAFSVEDQLIGFATVDHNFFGEKYRYVLLDQLFITLDQRGKGIGRKLFERCAEAAIKWKADKIYICAGSAEETIAFYHARGCKKALEVNTELYDLDPKDLQLEYTLEV